MCESHGCWRHIQKNMRKVSEHNFGPWGGNLNKKNLQKFKSPSGYLKWGVGVGGGEEGQSFKLINASCLQ